ncbi:MAG: TetR/AcrR family transcriptional regulator [Proteobacteria bacterium]|nr:TetR/AcrR family transcriptional regulator [Pseudomonadota bacterium]MBU1450844.1 TetR/AcrR family transcriptional regulator [Pseudomonadota bacterium]MBU2470053.1 TetR/AcrR family transcriptional regulator [Pseudomonadota bacterium]MBU2518441.1 TetR/AcrR family transcriptional regulator [Pseudomonadota bacterium]
MHETRSTWRDLQKQQTRQIILEAAKELFETLGYGKTTIRAVAKYAGVGVGTVMSHFKDKASLLSAALMGDWERLIEEVAATTPVDANYRTQLLHAAKIFFEYYARRPSLSRNLLKEAMFSLEVQGPELTAMDQAAREIGVRTLRSAQQRGEIRPDVDCEVMHLALFGEYCFVCTVGLSQPEPDPDQMLAMLESLTDLIARGASPESPGTK